MLVQQLIQKYENILAVNYTKFALRLMSTLSHQTTWKLICKFVVEVLRNEF